MKAYKYLPAFFILLLGGCYKDKGNYNYTKVNDFQIQLSPQSPTADNRYVINQPATDTLIFVLQANVSQTVNQNNENLRFEWIRTVTVEGSKARKDTVYEPEITLQFPPAKQSSHSLSLKVTDVQTGIEYRKDISLKTKIPYTKSWIILHGRPGERMIGAIEWNEEGEATWTPDLYLTTTGIRRFQNAKELMYISTDYNLNAPEKLFVAGEDSIIYLHPFNASQMLDYQAMIAGLGQQKIKKVVGNNLQFYMGFINESGRYFNGRGLGYFYNTPVKANVGSYQAEMAYVSREGYTTIWDKKGRCFLWYNAARNNYPRDGSRSNDAITEQIDQIPAHLMAVAELQDKEVLFSGRGTTATDENEDAMFVLKDNAGVCYLYQFNYGFDYEGGSGEVVNLRRDTLGQMGFDQHTWFATSSAYDGQVFYTRGNEIYQYKLFSREEILLYAANEGVRISQMRFRLENDFYLNAENMNILGAVVEKADGTSAFHEIRLSRGADVEQFKKYEFSFGPIQDFIFTNLQRRIL